MSVGDAPTGTDRGLATVDLRPLWTITEQAVTPRLHPR